MNEDLNFGGQQRAAKAPCEELQPLRSLLAAGGELDPAEESRLAAHLAECAACSDDLARERETLAILSAQHVEPDAALLASCRAGLQDALDREEERGWIARTFGLLLPSSWISPRPAWSAAILLLIGFSVGLFVPRLLIRKAPVHPQQERSVRAPAPPPRLLLAQKAPPSQSAPDSTTPPPGSALAALDLQHATVAGISVLPSDAGVPPEVQLQLNAPEPFTLQGTADDGDVRDVLLYVLRHGDLFAPDMRLNAVNALSPRSANPEVHSALSHVMRQDADAAVRLKALQALNGPGPADLMQRMLLDALSGDEDPGVREQAIDTLRDLADSGQLAPSGPTLQVLRNHAQSDSDVYVRTQSAAVVRELVSQQSGTP